MEKENVYRFRISEQKYRLIMMVGLYLGIILFVLAIIVLAKNVEEIKNDPIIYGMEKHNFNSCSCTDENFQTVRIVASDYDDSKEIKILNDSEVGDS